MYWRTFQHSHEYILATKAEGINQKKLNLCARLQLQPFLFHYICYKSVTVTIKVTPLGHTTCMH